MKKIIDYKGKTYGEKCTTHGTFPGFLGRDTFKKFPFTEQGARDVRASVTGPKYEEAAKDDLEIIGAVFEGGNVQQRVGNSHIENPQKGIRDVCKRFSLKFLVEFDHIHTRHQWKDQKIIAIGNVFVLNEERKAKNTHAAQRAKCFLNDHAVQSCQCIKFKKGEKANEKENCEITPFTIDNAGNYNGSTEDGRDESLDKIAIILE
jgi:hypothetical protein